MTARRRIRASCSAGAMEEMLSAPTSPGLDRSSTMIDLVIGYTAIQSMSGGDPSRAT